MKNWLPYLYRIFTISVCLIFSSCGGAGETTNLEESTNLAPNLIVNAVSRLPENQLRIGDIVTSDPDGDAVTIELSGADYLSIVERENKLAFRVAPDFESPVDLDLDNVYLFEVTATDGDLSISRSLSVEVINVVEAKYDEAIFE